MSYGVINGLTGSYKISPARTRLPIAGIAAASGVTLGATPNTFKVAELGYHQIDLNINLSSPSRNVPFTLELFNATSGAAVQQRTGVVPGQAFPSDIYFGFEWNNLSPTDEYAFYITPDPGTFYPDYAMLVSDLNFRAVVQNRATDMLASLNLPEVAHVGAGTVQPDRWNVLNGASEYAVALPEASAYTGRFLGIRAADNAFAVLLTPQAGQTVYSASQGASTYGWYFCGNNSAILVSDGTSWRMISESRGINLCTLNFAPTESAATIQARINALPRTIEADASNTGLLYLDFADGTYTIDQTIYVTGFNGRALYIRGNMTENYNALHTNQAVILDGSASDNNVLTVLACALMQLQVWNIAIAVKTDGAADRIGLSIATCVQAEVRGCYVYGNSDAYGYGLFQSNTPEGNYWYNYFSNIKYGLYIQRSVCSVLDCDDTGTPPKYGIVADSAVVFSSVAELPTGSVANITRTNGGLLVPVTEDDITLSDVTTLNVSTTKHGFAPKAVAPAAGLLNVLGIANGETALSNKTITGVAVADATGAGDVVAQLNALLASLRATKIIAT